MNSLIPANSSKRNVHCPSAAERHLIWIAGALLLVILSNVTSRNISPIQTIYAGTLLAISIYAYLSWRRGNGISAPIWTLVCAAHFVYYGLAIFGARPTSPSMFDHNRDLPDSAISAAMLVGIIGLSSMAIGRFAALHFANLKRIRPSFLEMQCRTPLRIQLLLILGIAANLFGIPLYGTVAWNISVIVFSMIPLAAFLWVIVGTGIRELPWLDLWLAIIFLITRLISGATFNASLGTIVIPLYLMGLAALVVKRKLPLSMIAVVTCIVIFLQPAKSVIREEIYRGRLGKGMTDAMVRWIDVASSGWAEVLSGRRSMDDQLSPVALRSSLLTMTGLILDKTPDRVPFQFGTYYPLLLQNLIPRVLWPEKPSVNVANQLFQVKYGLTNREQLSSVSIACGFEAEGYMNFGWYGILGIGLLVGFVVGTYEMTFFWTGSGRTAIAVGLAMLPGFLTIESQLVQYLGGILQFTFAAGLIFHQNKGKEFQLGSLSSGQRQVVLARRRPAHSSLEIHKMP